MQSGCQQHEPTEASKQNIANRSRNSLPLGREGRQAENEKLKAELQTLSEQQTEQSEALQELSTVLETLSSTFSQL